MNRSTRRGGFPLSPSQGERVGETGPFVHRRRNTQSISLNFVVAAAFALALCAGCQTDSQQKSPAFKAAMTARETMEIATEAYLFGYPLVKMDLTRQVMTNVRFPEGMNAPPGQFARIRSYPSAANHEITTPSADTLYTAVWLDVAKEPWVLSLPDTQDRYCLFPMLDGWSTVFEAPGKRTTGTGPQKYAITGPGWKGKLPAGLKECKSPTSLVWVIGRVSCTGTSDDYTAAHAIQDKCSAVPLSAYGQPYAPQSGSVDPAIDMETPVREQLRQMNVGAFFNRLALLMRDNPPARADAPILKKMARLGIIPGQPFDINKLSAAEVQALMAVPEVAFARMKAWFKDGAKAGDSISQNGWTLTLKTGLYGTDYIQRAMIAAIGLGASLPQDTFYAISIADGAGEPYSGNFRYVMHFPPGQIPSVNAFWSLTMYDADYFFVENALGRYSLGSRDELKLNGDGSLDIYIQRHPTAAGLASNWLPAAQEKFILMLRFYWPKENMLNGTWKVPPVNRAN
jgi:hypothetical protein